MAKYKDTREAPKSRMIAKRRGEKWNERHQRRLDFNFEHRQTVENWCFAHQVTFVISNGGHHWRFYIGAGCFAQWWPSSAKLILKANWQNGIHVHDYERMLEMLMQQLMRDQKDAAPIEV